MSNRVIGTAGHVDHGKTALIRAMTGIDADRLPVEKARGMTTDLGFAHYTGGDGVTIGIVDVPGHERYLRNMVAGAWGLDLVMLVVAADDGWMPQTGLHASIVASMAAPAVIIVVTKSDAVPEGRPQEVAADARARASIIFGHEPPSLVVSAMTGLGIDQLKGMIDTVLASLPEPEAVGHSTTSHGGAYLYVDRVFAPRSGGTVVTGTLRGGSIATGDELHLYHPTPTGTERVRIKGLQGYHEAVNRLSATSRAAIALSGLREPVQRGDLLAAEPGSMVTGSELLCKVLPLPGMTEPCRRDARGKPLLRPGMEAEIAVGTAHAAATVWPFRQAAFIRVVLDRQVSFPDGAAFALLRTGGAELLARGYIVGAGETTPVARRGLEAALVRAGAAFDVFMNRQTGRAGHLESRHPAPAPAPALDPVGSKALPDHASAVHVSRMPGPVVMRLMVEVMRYGVARLPPSWPQDFAVDGSGTAGTASDTPGLAGPFATGLPGADGGIVFEAGVWRTIRDELTKAASQPQGLSGSAVETVVARCLCGRSCNASVLADGAAAALARLVADGVLVKDGAVFRVRGAPPALDPEQASMLARLEAAGKAGLEPGKTTAQPDARLLKVLCTLGHAVPLDGGIFIAARTYDACVAAILDGRAIGDRFSVPAAKDRSGLSRKYILPLLNRMEARGLVRRSGDERIVTALAGK